MKKQIGCYEYNGKYLIMKEDGKSEIINSEKEFKEYLTKNNCEVAS